MGASSSHEEISQEGSPDSPPYTNRSRVLSVDPRSPTNDITRTPIVVDKTPEGLLQDLMDPRSPTVGIDRTPLAAPNGGKTVHRFDLNALDNEPTDHVTKSCDEDGSLLPEHHLGVTGIEDLSLEDFPTCESTRLVPTGEQLILDMTRNAKLKKKKQQKTSKPKELFPSKTSSSDSKMAAIPAKPSSLLKDVTRSPLSTRTVDINSPAHIVQRKQIKDIDKKLTCAQDNSMSKFIVREKENM
ncbi:cell division cycle-associated protein 3-like [Dreissena polymorpha]|uniref:Uncharacterized protein n=1 Tax=Dreissena polymorpha TaxID=45954 RepID=A0A9D4R950_DREPO|nr:cell division cycle-associated protein 3-like [Dreissena polymorpha]KAH3858317.1 hypothetical protein DPMN_100940 [Dreissena polymorpha]